MRSILVLLMLCGVARADDEMDCRQELCAPMQGEIDRLDAELKSRAKRGFKRIDIDHAISVVRMRKVACERQCYSEAQRRAEELRQQEEEARAEQERQEQEAAAKAKADAEQQALIEAIKADKKQMAAIFGAGFCLIKRYRDNALKELSAQRKASRRTGVQNTESLLALQEAVRRADELEASDRRDLKDYSGVTPMGCAAQPVQFLVLCKTMKDDKPTPNPCEEGKAPLMLALVTDPWSEDEE